MMALVEIRRQPTGRRNVFRGRLCKIVWKAGFLINCRVPVEIEPPRVVIGNYVNHQVRRSERLETLVSKRVRELQAKRRMLVHHDREPRRVAGRGLDDHVNSPALAVSTLSFNTVRAARAPAPSDRTSRRRCPS